MRAALVHLADRLEPLGERLRVLELAIVIGVRPDPNPQDVIRVSNAYRAVVDPDADRSEAGTADADGLEVQTRVEGIIAEQSVGVAGPTLDRVR